MDYGNNDPYIPTPMSTAERIRMIEKLVEAGVNVVTLARYTDTVLRKVYYEKCPDPLVEILSKRLNKKTS